MSRKAPGLLVEAAAHLDRERLRDVDLDVVDVVAVPDRLEHAVGEAQRQQVLDRLAAEVVVDAEDAAARRRPRAARAFSARAEARSVPNGFSMITRAPSPSPCVAELLDDPGRGAAAAARGRCSSSRLAAELLLGPVDRRRRASSSPSPTPAKRSDARERVPGSSVARARGRTRRPPRARARGTPRRRARCARRRRSGSAPASARPAARWNIPGSSLRCARSPVAPKRTITWSAGVIAGQGTAGRPRSNR